MKRFFLLARGDKVRIELMVGRGDDAKSWGIEAENGRGELFEGSRGEMLEHLRKKGKERLARRGDQGRV